MAQDDYIFEVMLYVFRIMLFVCRLNKILHINVELEIVYIVFVWAELETVYVVAMTI